MLCSKRTAAAGQKEIVRYFQPLVADLCRTLPRRAMWHGAHGGSSLAFQPAISPSSTTRAPSLRPCREPGAEPGPLMATAAIQTMLRSLGRSGGEPGPHGASRQDGGSEKASLRNMRSCSPSTQWACACYKPLERSPSPTPNPQPQPQSCEPNPTPPPCLASS